MIENLRRRLDLVLLLVVQGLFLLWPEIDLRVADWGYDAGQGFFLAEQAWVQWPYQVFAKLHIPVAIVLLWLYLASWIWRRHEEKGLRRRLAFLILSLALGPGLLVNEVFKAESGRARPGQVEQFGGPKQFTPVFAPADQCERNCSFVSGHAAMGFYFIGLAWVLRDRRWLWLGIGLGLAVGAGRMLQGGHFLSDILFAFWLVYGVNVALARWLLGRWSIASPSSSTTA